MNTARLMPLASLLEGHVQVDSDLRVSGLSLDSRSVRPGHAFVALRGTREHGIRFAPKAVAAGAVAILSEPHAPAEAVECAVPVILIEDLRERLGAIAARFHGDASASLRVTGVTGTNGKTSTVQLLARALEHLGRRAATIGTLGAGLVGALDAGERTTPDVISVQRLLADFRAAGASDVAMEVSSHALDQGRVDGVHFTLAVFTNLSRDHLDYHGDMQAYGAAKARLFERPGLRASVINLDDAFGRELAAQAACSAPVIGYGIEAADAQVRALDVQTHAGGLGFHLRTPWGEGAIRSPLLGRFNVANLLAVAASLGALGHSFADIASALAVLEPVPGRMRRLGAGAGQALVVVDYAHTPDALEQTLASLRAHCEGELVCVFGCGGERDVGKRALMAEVAERLSDRVIVTDDNPRGESGDAIVADIQVGFAAPARVHIERDRARAIEWAISSAREGDIVLIAGKGHEPYQEIAGQRIPFDDAVIAARVLEGSQC